MGKKLIAVLLILFLTCSIAIARKIGVADMPELLQAGQYDLVLNGAGFRKLMLIKTIACGLYLKEKNSDFQEIIAADEFMAVRLYFVFRIDIPGKSLKKEWGKCFDRVCNGSTEAIQEEIETFLALIPEKLVRHDIYELIYIPDKGVNVYHNGELRGIIKGLEFKKKLFSIWLGERPEEKQLKDRMLGVRN